MLLWHSMCPAAPLRRCVGLLRCDGVSCCTAAKVCPAAPLRRCVLLLHCVGVPCCSAATMCQSAPLRRCVLLLRSDGVSCCTAATMWQKTNEAKSKSIPNERFPVANIISKLPPIRSMHVLPATSIATSKPAPPPTQKYFPF